MPRSHAYDFRQDFRQDTTCALSAASTVSPGAVGPGLTTILKVVSLLRTFEHEISDKTLRFMLLSYGRRVRGVEGGYRPISDPVARAAQHAPTHSTGWHDNDALNTKTHQKQAVARAQGRLQVWATCSSFGKGACGTTAALLPLRRPPARARGGTTSETHTDRSPTK